MSAACAERLEVLGAWLDGEASEPEVAELQRHLAVCPGCREASACLADLGSSVAHQPTVQPPADFAARTARLALAGAAHPGGLRRWAAEFVSATSGRSGAVGVLLGREGRGRPSPALVLVLFGVPALLLGFYNPTLPDVFLKIAAGLLLFALPVHHWQARVARLGSLKRGRALEEMLLSGMTPARLLDGLALAGLGGLAWAGLGFGVLLLPTTEWLWLPALLALAWLGSYPAACWSLGQGSWLALLGAGAALTFAWAFWPGALFVLFLVAGCRAMALRRLRHELPGRPAGARPLRNRWLLRPSENPVAMRENLRRAARTAPLAAALRHLPLALLSAAWAAWFCRHPSSDHAWPGLALLLAVVVGQAAWRTLGAVLHERERGTWEPLLQAGGGGREFVAGWLLVAAGEAFLGLVAVFPLTLAAASMMLSVPPQRQVLLVVESWALTWVAALLGLNLSARSRTLARARSSLLAWGCGLTAMVLGLVSLGQSLVPELGLADVVLASVALAGGLAALWSWRSLERSLSLASPAGVPSSLRGHLALSAGMAGSALGAVLRSWPNAPRAEWATVLDVLLGASLGWLAGGVLGFLVAPLLRYPGRTRLARWMITLFWGAVAGLAVGGLRLAAVVLDVLPDCWAYDQIALSIASGAAMGALLAFFAPVRFTASLPSKKDAALSLGRLALALGLLATYLSWEFYLPPVDIQPILAQVEARRLASRQLPPGATRVARLLRGDWPHGAGAPYVSAEQLRRRVAEVAAAVRTGQIPASDPALPLAMDFGLLVGVETALVALSEQEPDRQKSFEYLLLAVEWAGRARILARADEPLRRLTAEVGEGRLTALQLQTVLSRTRNLSVDFLEVCDDVFAGSLEELEADRAYFPDRPEFYWKHARHSLAFVYVTIRPACRDMDPSAIARLQDEARRQCGPVLALNGALARYDHLVANELLARQALAHLRSLAHKQLGTPSP